MNASIDLLGWNIETGGYNGRPPFDAATIPEREDAIKALIRRSRVDSAALTDAYGWRQRYGNNDAIAQHLGFAAARFAPLADDRIDKGLGPDAGLVFATDHEIEHSSPIDLDNRQGLATILKLGERTLQIATVYLDDLSEDVRLKQLKALLNNLEPEPTVMIGDLNSLRPDMQGASMSTKIHDLGFRAIAALANFSFTFIPDQKKLESVLTAIGRRHQASTAGYYRHAVCNMNRRQVIQELGKRGWQDADAKKQPTIRKFVGIGLDYAFHNTNVRTDNFQVIPANGASDHDAIRVRVHVS